MVRGNGPFSLSAVPSNLSSKKYLDPFTALKCFLQQRYRLPASPLYTTGYMDSPAPATLSLGFSLILLQTPALAAQLQSRIHQTRLAVTQSASHRLVAAAGVTRTRSSSRRRFVVSSSTSTPRSLSCGRSNFHWHCRRQVLVIRNGWGPAADARRQREGHEEHHATRKCDVQAGNWHLLFFGVRSAFQIGSRSVEPKILRTRDLPFTWAGNPLDICKIFWPIHRRGG